jgi:hypothetical protein
MTRVAGLGSVVLLVVHVLFAVGVYWELPAEIPQHFDASGAPTRFAATTPWSWFLLPAIAVATWGLMAFVARRLPSHPEWFNFPQQARFVALAPEYRGSVIDEMRALLALASALVTALFLVIQLMTWRVAVDGSAGALGQVPLVFSFLFVPLLLVWLPRLRRAVEDAERQAVRDASLAPERSRGMRTGAHAR